MLLTCQELGQGRKKSEEKCSLLAIIVCMPGPAQRSHSHLLRAALWVAASAQCPAASAWHPTTQLACLLLSECRTQCIKDSSGLSIQTLFLQRSWGSGKLYLTTLGLYISKCLPFWLFIHQIHILKYQKLNQGFSHLASFYESHPDRCVEPNWETFSKD